MHRSLSRLAATALAVLLAVAVEATPAHASIWQLNDGFESNPAATWSCWHTVEDPSFVNGCNIGFSDPNAHSPSHASWIQGNSGWSDIGRTVHLTPFLAGRTLNCAAQLQGKVVTNNTQLHGQLEVIDVASWTYITIKPFVLTKANDFLLWRAITTSAWTPPHADVFVRIGLIGENLNQLDALEVDDLIVQCGY